LKTGLYVYKENILQIRLAEVSHTKFDETDVLFIF